MTERYEILDLAEHKIVASNLEQQDAFVELDKFNRMGGVYLIRVQINA